MWVEAKRLDDVLLRELKIDKITLVKIDVEGAELGVLEGLTKVLKTKRPKLIIEVRNENESGVLSLLESFGYIVSQVPGSGWEEAKYIYAYPRDVS